MIEREPQELVDEIITKELLDNIENQIESLIENQNMYEQSELSDRLGQLIGKREKLKDWLK